MPPKIDILRAAGEKVVMLGNEAIARGALEAGIGFFAYYPGTPSSEVGDAICSVSKKLGFHAEISTNEKVAFEAAAGAAMAGVRAMTSAKHFGLNVMSDSVGPVVYNGVQAGLVLVIADDPHGWSSAQSEQDTRWYGRVFDLPILEPSNPQEAKEFTKLAFKISEEFGIPVMLHTTTKVNHAIGTVKFGTIGKIKTSGEYKKLPEQYFSLSPGLQRQHALVLKKLEGIEKKYDKINLIGGKKASKTGIITSGVCYEFLLENNFDKYAKIAKLNLVYPFPKKFVKKFLKGLKRVFIVEQLEPFIEQFVKEIVADNRMNIEIHGKDIIPRVDELETDVIYSKLAPFFKLKVQNWKALDKAYNSMKIPIRRPALCPGCPHRSTFYATNKVFGHDVPYPGDIGCYILGIFEPFKTQDYYISMGGGVGTAHGISKTTKQRPVVFIGDSTFFHAGIPQIINMHWNKSNSIIIVLDNDVTAMTGQQPHPGTGLNIQHEPAPKIMIEDVLKAIGIENIEIASTWNNAALQEALKKVASSPKLGVVIARGPCRLLMRRQVLSQGRDFVKYWIDPEKCTRCGECIDHFACPAIHRKIDNSLYWIDPHMCWGCSVCAQICPAKAISVKKNEQNKQL